MRNEKKIAKVFSVCASQFVFLNVMNTIAETIELLIQSSELSLEHMCHICVHVGRGRLEKGPKGF